MPPPISTSPSAMAKVPHPIALGHAVDETSSLAEWHIPRAHYLESWGDARAVGGTLSVVQPLILPLFGGRTPVEVLGLMVGDKDRPGYDIVRDTWKPILGEAEFDRKWNRVLHDGLLAGSELTEVVSRCQRGGLCRARARDGIGEWFGDRVRPVAVASRRPVRERRMVAGASRSPDQAHVGQSRAREPEDCRDAWSCERGVGPSRLCRPLARAAGLDPPRHGGRRGGPHAWLRPSARGTRWIWRRVRHIQGPNVQGAGIRQRRHVAKARTHVPALGDAGPRQHGGSSSRPRVHGRPNFDRRRGRRKPVPVRSACSRRSPNTSHSSRSTPTTRGTSGG